MKLVFVLDSEIRQVMDNVEELEIDEEAYSFLYEDERTRITKGKADIYVLENDVNVKEYASNDVSDDYIKVDEVELLREEIKELRQGSLTGSLLR